jgi:hypothetical protein
MDAQVRMLSPAASALSLEPVARAIPSLVESSAAADAALGIASI